MVQIFRKEGWKLNDNDKTVNSIIRRIEANNGECPCYNESKNKTCPCSGYVVDDICHCGLYIKINNKTSNA